MLASSRAHIDSTAWRAAAGSRAASSISMSLPWRTSPTPPKPRPWSALAMAWPCGSSTPGLRVMWMRAFIGLPARLLHRVGTLEVPRAALGQDAEPARDFLIGLLD